MNAPALPARIRAGLLALLLLAFAPRAARAQENVLARPDSGRLVVFSGGRAVGTEDFVYEVHGDSLIVTSVAERKARARDGSVKTFRKTMGMIANVSDFSIRTYVSSQEYDGHTMRRQIIPEDTMLTATLESDERGAADKLPRPPGRFYILDGALYTLFDLVARNLHGRLFGDRTVGIVAMGDSTVIVSTHVRPLGADTVSWGGRRVITSRIAIEDENARFTLWSDPKGRMLRLENADNDLAVMREPPPPPAPRPKRARAAAPAKPAAR